MSERQGRSAKPKIGRNELCPCGSGLKYKKCCLRKTDLEKRVDAFFKASNDVKRKAREKVCLYPDHAQCSEKIIKAHAVQNNRILKKLAVNGEVVTNDGSSNIFFQNTQLKGRRIATTFTGFCSFHDKTVFQDIEDNVFSGTQKQIFLYTYRTMAWHYQKKREQVNALKLTLERMAEQGYHEGNNSELKKRLSFFDMGLDDNDEEKKFFDNAILSSMYDVVSCRIWEIPYEISFAISMMHELEYDLAGNVINDMTSKDRPMKVYLNIFPDEDKSFCIWSWLKEWDYVMDKFADQFMGLGITDKENYLNNKLPIWSDSLVLSPKLVEQWGPDVQEAFIAHANFDMLYAAMEREMSKDERAFKYMDTPWNLFEKLE